MRMCMVESKNWKKLDGRGKSQKLSQDWSGIQRVNKCHSRPPQSGVSTNGTPEGCIFVDGTFSEPFKRKMKVQTSHVNDRAQGISFFLAIQF